MRKIADAHIYPYFTFFKKRIKNLGEPDKDGWAIGDCPFCGESGAFRANLRNGRWLCFPETKGRESQSPPPTMN